MVTTVLIHGRLNHRLEPALVVVVECDELEGLKMPGDGTQHFRYGKHRARRGQKHQLYFGTVIQRFRQGEQAAGNRDDLQFGWYATTIRESKNSRGGFCEAGARSTA